MNILILTRNAKINANSIYNSYTNGIVNNYSNSIIIDYFDLYFQHGKKEFENIILNIISKNKIDMIFINFVSGDLTFDLLFLKRIAKIAYIIMNFYDSELFFEPIDRYYAQCADLVLLPTSSYFTSSYTLLDIKAISIFSLYDTKLYQKQDIKKDIDISFVGDISKKSRQTFLNHLTASGYRVETFGYGTKHGIISFKEMINIFNRSKINLNFSDTIDERSFNRHTNTDYSIVPNIMKYMTQIKGRSIEIALCGGFVLSQYATAIDELFNNQEIAVFKDEDELLHQVKYYLQNDAKRDIMRQNAYKKASHKYDATKVFSKVLNEIDIHTKKKKIIYTDKGFLSNYSTYHTLYLFNFLFKLKFSLFIEEFKIIQWRNIKIITALRHLKQQFYYQIIKRRKSL